MKRVIVSFCFVSCLNLAHAGLYNRAEPPIAADTDLDQFLNTLAGLRSYGPPDFTVPEESKGRKDYLQKIAALRNQGRLSPDDQANLGAYLIRVRTSRSGVPDYDEAVQVLSEAQRAAPRNFHVLSNLATAHLLAGRLDAAQRFLLQAMAVAPEEWREFEKYQLRLIQSRSRESYRPGLAEPDRLFNVAFPPGQDEWKPGSHTDSLKDKLPPNAMEIVQQLLIWMPDDGRLHWLFGELANARSEMRAAHRAMNIAVDTFRLSTPTLMERRRILREEIAKNKPAAPDLSTLDFGDEGETQEAPPPPSVENPFAQIGWRGWSVVGIGAVVLIGLVAMQLREIGRRRGAGKRQ